MANPAELPYPEGHDRVYRLIASGSQGSPPLEAKYFVSPYEARQWRDRLRAVGYGTAVACAPAHAFTAMTDADLERLAAQEEEGERGKD